MKKYLWLTLGLVVLVASAAGVAGYRTTGDTALRQALTKHDAMEWLRADFALSDAQFGAIKRLHENYSLGCEEHCRRIQAATRVRNDLRAQAPGEAAALVAAERRLDEVRFACESAMLTHVRQCAAEMSPDAGKRYLALVLPKIKDFDHLAAPDVQLSPHAH